MLSTTAPGGSLFCSDCIFRKSSCHLRFPGRNVVRIPTLTEEASPMSSFVQTETTRTAVTPWAALAAITGRSAVSDDEVWRGSHMVPLAAVRLGMIAAAQSLANPERTFSEWVSLGQKISGCH